MCVCVCVCVCDIAFLHFSGTGSFAGSSLYTAPPTTMGGLPLSPTQKATAPTGFGLSAAAATTTGFGAAGASFGAGNFGGLKGNAKKSAAPTTTAAGGDGEARFKWEQNQTGKTFALNAGAEKSGIAVLHLLFFPFHHFTLKEVGRFCWLRVFQGSSVCGFNACV